MSRVARLRDRLGVSPTVLGLSIARLADGIGNSLLIILIPLYVEELPDPGFPRPVLVGLLIGLFGLVNAFAQPLAGALSDRLGRRKVFVQLGLLIMAVGTLAFLLAADYVDLVATRAVQGLGFALTVTASVAIIADETSRRQRGGALGVYTTFRMVGFALGPLLGGWIHVTWGFDAAFWAGAAFIVVAMGFVQAWVAEPAVEREVAEHFRVFDPELWTGPIAVLGLTMFVMAAAIAMMSTLENEFNARLEQTALGFGFAFSALTVSRLLFQVPLGAWSDRIGRKPFVLAGLALLVPTTAWTGWVGSTLELVAARFAQGIATAAVAAPAYALAADLSSARGTARQLAVLTMGFSLGIALGPLAAGFLSLRAFEAPFVVGGAICLPVLALVYRIVPETIDV